LHDLMKVILNCWDDWKILHWKISHQTSGGFSFYLVKKATKESQFIE